MTAFQPVRLAIVALVISRPRPLSNLFAYWLGGLALGIPAMLIPLFVLHSTPAIESFTTNMTTSGSLRHVQVSLGVLALAIAVVLMARASSRRREPAPAAAGGSSAVLVQDPSPPPLAGLTGPAADEERGSRRRGLWARARAAWESGSLWVAAVIGMATGGPSLDGIVLGTALIVTSGASVGTQVLAALAFTFGALMVVEAILLCSVFAPVKTKSVLEIVHDWVQRHRRGIVVVSTLLIGVVLLTQGLTG
ncbi:GAP family protein [Mycolicibacterium confluentis]|nr:GAP family protein [Mycolicibacterium confluentis]